MQQAELHEILFLAYTIPVGYYKTKDMYYIRKALFNVTTPQVAYPSRGYCLHPQYVRCAICGTYWHNTMGIQDILIVGCRKCELHSMKDFNHIANSHVRVINYRLHTVTREAMLSINQAARDLLSGHTIEGASHDT
jgi:hypothetical protein